MRTVYFAAILNKMKWSQSRCCFLYHLDAFLHCHFFKAETGQLLTFDSLKTLQETNIIPPWEEENHLQTCLIDGGFVSSLKGFLPRPQWPVPPPLSWLLPVHATQPWIPKHDPKHCIGTSANQNHPTMRCLICLEQKLSKVYKKNNFKRKTSDFRVFKGQESSLTKVSQKLGDHIPAPLGDLCFPFAEFTLHRLQRRRSVLLELWRGLRLSCRWLHGMPKVKDEKNHLPVGGWTNPYPKKNMMDWTIFHHFSGGWTLKRSLKLHHLILQKIPFSHHRFSSFRVEAWDISCNCSCLLASSTWRWRFRLHIKSCQGSRWKMEKVLPV